MNLFRMILAYLKDRFWCDGELVEHINGDMYCVKCDEKVL